MRPTIGQSQQRTCPLVRISASFVANVHRLEAGCRPSLSRLEVGRLEEHRHTQCGLGVEVSPLSGKIRTQGTREISDAPPRTLSPISCHLRLLFVDDRRLRVMATDALLRGSADRVVAKRSRPQCEGRAVLLSRDLRTAGILFYFASRSGSSRGGKWADVGALTRSVSSPAGAQARNCRSRGISCLSRALAMARAQRRQRRLRAMTADESIAPASVDERLTERACCRNGGRSSRRARTRVEGVLFPRVEDASIGGVCGSDVYAIRRGRSVSYADDGEFVTSFFDSLTSGEEGFSRPVPLRPAQCSCRASLMYLTTLSVSRSRREQCRHE